MATLAVGCRAPAVIAKGAPAMAFAPETGTPSESGGWRMLQPIDSAPVRRPFEFHVLPSGDAVDIVRLRLIRSRDMAPAAEWTGNARAVSTLCAPDLDDYILMVDSPTVENLLEFDVASAKQTAAAAAGARPKCWPNRLDVWMLSPSTVNVTNRRLIADEVILSYFSKEHRQVYRALPLNGDSFDQPCRLFVASTLNLSPELHPPSIGADRTDVIGRLWRPITGKARMERLANIGSPGSAIRVMCAATGAAVVGAAIRCTKLTIGTLEGSTDDEGRFRLLDADGAETWPTWSVRRKTWLYVSAPGYESVEYVTGPLRETEADSDVDVARIHCEAIPRAIYLNRRR